ncbi:pro-Pol polyprotein [Trichonephila clavipes]|nr:pro-Pol polyprotein [Trichonephila clavipes]
MLAMFQGHLEQCNVQQLFHVRPTVTGKPKVRDIWGISDLEGEKDFNDDHIEEITDFVQSIPGFQECDEDVEARMACDAEDWGFQMVNDDEIVTSVQEKSNPIDDETDEDEDNSNNESTNKKTGKKEGFLNPISKESIPLSAYHVDFIGPLPSTNKSYQHIFTVVDAFTNFTWLYPVKTVSAESALEKLKQQQKTFGNPIRIISDRGSAFASKLFNDYCDEENIQHLQIATGVPRGN